MSWRRVPIYNISGVTQDLKFSVPFWRYFPRQITNGAINGIAADNPGVSFGRGLVVVIARTQRYDICVDRFLPSPAGNGRVRWTASR